jgi:Domain of unknown function (DUF4194)
MIQLNPSDNDSKTLPEFKEWSVVAARLLQSVIYADEEHAWTVLLRSQSNLESYFARIGLVLVVNEADGMAYLRQLTESESTGGYDRIPRLFRRVPLSFEATLLCVLLRDALRRFEEEDIDNQRCVLEFDQLFETWKTFFPRDEDEVKIRKSLEKNLRKLDEFRFVRKFGDDGNSWEVRPILKARLPIDELEKLRDQLRRATGANSVEDPASAE